MSIIIWVKYLGFFYILFLMKKIKKIPSENFNERAGGKIDMLILHYTATKDAEQAIEFMTCPKRSVSAHYLIKEDGSIIQMVDEEKRAWHAGVSYWQGERDINSRSIGIEIQNRGHEAGCPPYPAAQIRAVIALCRDILARRAIPPEHVLGHSDVAPDRKIDPGEHFPWKKLAGKGIGRWPKGTPPKGLKGEDLDKLLLKMGYSPDVTADERRRAFFMHFYPEAIGRENSKSKLLAGARRARKLIDFS